MGETISLAQRCRDIVHRSAVLETLRQSVLLPILGYYADPKEQTTPLTMQSDPVHLVWQILRQGAFLCELVNELQPGILPRYTMPLYPLRPTHFGDINSRQNLAVVIRACKDMFFMTDDELFVPGDLYKDDYTALGKALHLAERLLGNKLRVSTTIGSMNDLRKTSSLSPEDLALFDFDPIFPVAEAGETEESNGTRPLAQDEGKRTSAQSSASSTGKVQRLLDELVESERVYVDDLVRFSRYSEAIKFERLLTQEAWTCIFGRLRELLNVQQRFMTELETASKNLKQLGELFVRYETPFVVYERYCVGYYRALDVVNEERMNLGKRQDLIDTLGSDIASSLIKPIQRLTKYQLFLRDLTKDSQHLELEESWELTLGKAALERILERINEQQREQENIKIAVEFFAHFPAKRVEASQTGRLLLYKAPMEVRLDENGKLYQVYLFEKRLFICQERDRISIFWIKAQISTGSFCKISRVDGLSVRVDFDVEEAIERDGQALNSIVLVCKHAQEADIWEKSLNRLLQGQNCK
jgi:hypothetical protein